MNQRGVLSILAAAALALVVVATGSSGGPLIPGAPLVTVASQSGNGMPTFPTVQYTLAQLQAMPQSTATVTINGVPTTESGPLVSGILTSGAGFTPISSCKNDELRYWIQATNQSNGAATMTAGEIDTGFGNDPAILSLKENGVGLASPRLIMTADVTSARDISGVNNILVGRAAPQLANTATPSCTAAPFTAVPTPPVGSVTINGDVALPTTLTWAQLSAMPQVTQIDTFKSGANTTTVTETGPTLFNVLAEAEPQLQLCQPNDDLRFYVEVTSSQDGYAATVSWAELQPQRNNKQDLLSLAENSVSLQSQGPRFTAPGDIKGGRYVSGTAVVTVFRAPAGPGAAPNCVPSP